MTRKSTRTKKDVAARRARAHELAAAGHTIAAIARELGCSGSTAHDMVRRRTRELKREGDQAALLASGITDATPVEALCCFLSVATSNALMMEERWRNASRPTTIGALCRLTGRDLLAIRHVGRKGLRELREVLARFGRKLADPPAKESQPSCRFGAVCVLHGFVHGMEAEELRGRLEALEADLLADDETQENEAVGRAAAKVRAILDEVDARDSAAFGEVRLELDATIVEVGGEPPDVLLRPYCRVKVTEEQARELAPHLYQAVHVVAQGGRLVSWSQAAPEDGR